jgi:hypothetical protein
MQASNLVLNKGFKYFNVRVTNVKARTPYWMLNIYKSEVDA